MVQWLGGVGSIPGQGVKIPHASWPTNQNLKQKKFVTNSIKTLKMVHIKKNLKNNKLSDVECVTH